MPIETTSIEGYAHLGRTREGTAVVAEKPRFRVQDVASYYTCDYSAEEIQVEFPFLTLPEIHQAIAYYLDQREEIQNEMNAPSALTRLAQRG